MNSGVIRMATGAKVSVKSWVLCFINPQFYCRIVVDALNNVDEDRKCFRLINGILVQRTVKDVKPTLTTNRDLVSNTGIVVPDVSVLCTVCICIPVIIHFHGSSCMITVAVCEIFAQGEEIKFGHWPLPLFHQKSALLSGKGIVAWGGGGYHPPPSPPSGGP